MGERRCVVCRGGHCAPGTTTQTMHRNRTTLVIQQVPADVCDSCGEAYLSGDVAKELLETFESAVSLGVILDVRDFRAQLG